MNYIHKLRFQTNADWLAFKKKYKPAYFVVIGEVSRGGTYDDEGNVIEPPTVVTGCHVDILAESIIQETKPYNVGNPKHPAHGTGWGEPDYHIVMPEDYE